MWTAPSNAEQIFAIMMLLAMMGFPFIKLFLEFHNIFVLIKKDDGESSQGAIDAKQ